MGSLAFETRSKNQAKAMDSQNARIWSYNSLNNYHEFSPAVQNHLKRVYLTLCCALLASAFGAYLHMLWNIGGIVTTLGFTGTMIWLRSTPSYAHLSKRLFLLFLCAVLQGASVGPLINLVIDLDPSVPVAAFVGTAVTFACFSGAAMLARRREYLYLGASLSSAMSILWWVQIASLIFKGSTHVLKFELYFGLLVFMGYILVDTQMIIEKAHRGDMDYVQHSFTLFTDFGSLFYRILVLMFKKMKKGRKNRN